MKARQAKSNPPRRITTPSVTGLFLSVSTDSAGAALSSRPWGRTDCGTFAFAFFPAMSEDPRRGFCQMGAAFRSRDPLTVIAAMLVVAILACPFLAWRASRLRADATARAEAHERFWLNLSTRGLPGDLLPGLRRKLRQQNSDLFEERWPAEDPYPASTARPEWK